MTTAVVSPLRPSRTMSDNKFVFVGALIGAGLVHLAIAPEHLEESALIGGAMLAGAVAQFGLAFLVRNGVRSAALAAIVLVLNAGFIGGWLLAVTVGLPVEPHEHAGMMGSAMHGGLGHLEPVTLLGVLTAGLEALVIAWVVSGRSIWSRRG